MAKTKTVQIAGVEFELSTPYAEGQTINEFEAKALNQTRLENIGNNFRKAIKAAVEGVEGAKSLDAIRAEIAEYDANYQFTARASGGGSTKTPLEKMAEKLAKAYLGMVLKQKDMTMKAYIEANGKEAFDAKVAEVAEHPDIVKRAKEELKAQEKMAAQTLDIAV